MSNKLSLAQQIALLDDTAPTEIDPEDAFSHGQERETDNSGMSASREHYLDIGSSTLRRELDSIADPKYSGVKTSRQALFEDDDEHDVSSEDRSSSEERSAQSESESGADSSDHGSPQSKERELAGDEEVNDVTAALAKARSDDRVKGVAVSRQLDIWNTLVDARIRMQKAVVVSNGIPRSNGTLDANHDSWSKLAEEADLLVNELFTLQENLIRANESVQTPPRKRRRVSVDSGRDACQSTLRELTADASSFEHAYHSHLIQTLNKWSAKIQAVAPSVLLPSNRNAFTKNNQHLKSAVQLVEETISDQSKVLARTRIWRGKGSRFPAGDSNTEDAKNLEDAELFDDTDFYQQLLRDVIDGQGAGNEDWMALQKKHKAKKKVDTRASKGRKIRYEVHEKLQNFMVPVTTQAGVWHNEQVDELFSSLLGKGFESVLGPEKGMDPPVETSLGDFRVFA